MLAIEVEKLIRVKLPDAKVEVSDMTGTGDHFEIEIISKVFSGKTLIEQHQMVYTILGDEMDKRIHAVRLKTRAK